MLEFVKSNEFIRSVVLIAGAVGVALDPAQVQAIVGGVFGALGVIQAIRAALKAKNASAGK